VVHPGGELQPLVAEAAHDATGRAHTPEGLEEQPSRLLNLPIRIERHPPVEVMDKAARQPKHELATFQLVHPATVQARPQQVQLRFGHRPLQAEQQPVVELPRIVRAVLIQNQRLAQRADLHQPVPVARAPGQTRDLQPHHDPRSPQTHLADQVLEALATDRRGTRQAQVVVDHHHLLIRPAQGHRPLPQVVLTRRALGVLDHLAQRRLPDVEVGAAPQMLRTDLALGSHHRDRSSLSQLIATPASKWVRAGYRPWARPSLAPPLCGHGEERGRGGAGDEASGRYGVALSIQPTRPHRRTSS
jgi:hypothetical protein